MAFASINQASVGGGSSNALAIQSDGIFMPRLSTGQRTALALTAGDTGLTVYDFTLNNLFIWNGAAWESIPGSGDAGANGSVQYNDNGIVSGATNFVYDKVTGNVGVGAAPTEKLSVNGSIGFQNGGTQRWHITANASSNLVFTRSAVADRLTITSDGNVGIGVTPSAWDTAVFKAIQIGTGVGQASVASRTDNVNNTAYGLNYYYGSGDYRYIAAGRATNYEQASGKHYWNIDSGTQVIGAITSFTQAMTLTDAGDLLVGKTSAGFGTVGNEMRAVGEIFSTQASNSNAATTYHAYSTTAAVYRFYVGLGGTVFATNTVISAISDARLKENVQDIDVGLAAILSLKPRKFDWKSGKGKDIKGDRGFIAQEFETVFPNLVDDWKDPAPEGEAPYKSVRQDLIPVLVKAIQELTARVQTLEAR
jgi:hypothetical protein